MEEFLAYGFLFLCPLTAEAMGGQIVHLDKCLTGPSGEIVAERIEAGMMGAGCFDRFDAVQDCRIDLRDVARIFACVADDAACAGVCVRCAELNHEGTKGTKENTKQAAMGWGEMGGENHEGTKDTKENTEKAKAQTGLRTVKETMRVPGGAGGRVSPLRAPRFVTAEHNHETRLDQGSAAPEQGGEGAAGPASRRRREKN